MPITIGGGDSGLDLGSLADWVSAGASVLAVTSAVWIAFTERKRARRAEEANQIENIRRRARELKVLRHVHSLAQEASRTARNYGFRGRQNDMSYHNFTAKIVALNETAVRLMALPELPIDLFLQLSDLSEALGDSRIGKSVGGVEVGNAAETIRDVASDIMLKLERELTAIELDSTPTPDTRRGT